jgi:hypothetical protein
MVIGSIGILDETDVARRRVGGAIRSGRGELRALYAGYVPPLVAKHVRRRIAACCLVDMLAT